MQQPLRSKNWVENSKLVNSFRGSENLPMPGAAATALIRLVAEDECTPGEVGDAVELQAGLDTRIATLTNHDLRRSRRRARNLRQAIAQLGAAGTAHLALTLALDEDLAAVPTRIVDLSAFRRQARRHALAGWALGMSAEIPVPERALLCALLQDVGLLALDQVLPDFYPDLLDKPLLAPATLAEAEENLVSAPHPRVGAWLLKHWGVPVDLQSAVALSHEEHPADREPPLTSCVRLSTALATLALQPGDASRSRELATSAKNALSVDPAEIARVYRLAAATLADADAAFEKPVRSSPRSTVVTFPAAFSSPRATVRPPRSQDVAGYSQLADPFTSAQLLAREFDAAKAHGWPISVALLQMEGAGAPRARTLLDRAVRTLRETLRPSDLLGQHGQDQFLITMPGASRDDAAAAARRMTLALADLGLEGLGTATYAADAPVECWEDLLGLAERALSAARRVGSGVCSAR